MNATSALIAGSPPFTVTVRCGTAFREATAPTLPEALHLVALDGPAKNLSDNDVTNLEKIATLRGHAGRLRAHVVMAKAVLDHGGTDCEATARHILQQALALVAP